MEGPFDAGTVAAVMEHMNGDHAADCLVICRSVDPDATAAAMTGLDRVGAAFRIEGASGSREVHLGWTSEPATRADIRAELVGMLDAARTKQAR